MCIESDGEPMIKPVCDRCGSELTDFGGILFSPPQGHDVKKYHVCKECYAELIKGFRTK